VRTSHSNIYIAQAERLRIYSRDSKIKPDIKIITREKKSIYQEFSLNVDKNRKYTVEKIVSVYKSDDEGVKNPVEAAVECAKRGDFSGIFREHKKKWHDIWSTFDINIEGDVFSQEVLRLHIFHLLQVASGHSARNDWGIPARGLHGEAYRGHIFWDELFVLPLYDFNNPAVSRAVLMYRYRRLEEARKYARESGYNGAMFPWQSGSSGVEETQVIHLNPMSGTWGPDYSNIQRHISFAIAYNIWKYYERSGDFDFLKNYGAEMLLSIGQFISDLAEYNAGDGRYHIEGVMGPDEFHEKMPGSKKPGFRDNAYTNLLAVWTLLKAKKSLGMLGKSDSERLMKKIGLDDSQLNKWEDIIHKMNLVINKEGIVSQFDGYFGLKDINLNSCKSKYGNIGRMDRILKAEKKSPDAYKVAKQADFLMIFYLLSVSEVRDLFKTIGYKFDRQMLKKNYKYYVQHTSHGSTLSYVVHCYLAIVLRLHKEIWKWFMNVLRSDIYDTQGGTTPEGIHCGVMGGSINIVKRGFAGVKIIGENVSIDPDLPKQWKKLRFGFTCREKRFSLEIDHRNIAVKINPLGQRRETVPVEIAGREYEFRTGKTYKINYKK
jgi:trehalose/maltose hydrolase-like predicted phosphorylase